MKHKFTQKSVTEWIIGFLQYTCDSKVEIAMILQDITKAFDFHTNSERGDLAERG